MKRLITLAAATLAAGLLLAAPAQAIPDSGASSDTPGTSVTVSPKTLAVGGTISFRVTGFPAGEVVYVKIDDGTFCSASATHGACVVHQQRLDAHGAASGSFKLPSDVGTGKHWLRLLASQQVAGSGGGVKGYTARGKSDFTVTKAAAASSSSTSSAAASASATGTASSDATASTTDSVDDSGDTVPSAGATLSVDLPRPAVTVTVTATPSAAAESAASARPVAAAGTMKDSHPPYVGIAGLVVLAGLAGALVARRVRQLRQARRTGA